MPHMLYDWLRKFKEKIGNAHTLIHDLYDSSYKSLRPIYLCFSPASRCAIRVPPTLDFIGLELYGNPAARSLLQEGHRLPSAQLS